MPESRGDSATRPQHAAASVHREFHSLLGSPPVRRRLTALGALSLNFDPAELERASPADGWMTTDLCQPLPSESPGPPVHEGSWQQARRLMRGYEFADPSIVRAYYDPDVPLERRNMLLKLQALGIFHLYVGVRVGEVYERTLGDVGRIAHTWGWNYRTLQGHVEEGQMDWQVWKWLDTGEVEFRVHAKSRTAKITNPAVRVGFRALRTREREAFLESTKRRMRKFVELALEREIRSDAAIRTAAGQLTARRSQDAEEANHALARALREAAWREPREPSHGA